MKKVLAVLLCMVMVLSSVSVLAQEKVYNVSLDLKNKSPFGTFDGWGTSICWWGHHLGENLTEVQLDAVVKALYDEETGLGLNVARYNIGGGDDPTHNHQREFDGRDMPGVLDAEGNWNLENDAGQLLALQLCVKYGADILEAFSNSPPYFMTESGCSSGGHDSNKNNLPDDKFDDFAEFLAEAVLRIEKEYNVAFDTIDPLNEPNTNFWGYEGWQEGCHFDPEDHSRLIMEVRKALDKRGLTHVGVSAADEHNISQMGRNIRDIYTDEAVNTLAQVNAHSYSVGNYDDLKNAAIEANKPLYMTEVDGDGSIGGEASGSMGPALWLSNKINEDLRGLEPNAWVLWQAAAMAYDGEHKDSGYWNILSIDKETSELHLPKKYYAYKQFTSFIRPGDTLVKTDYSNIVSAINEEEGKVVFVITNTDSCEKEYKLDVTNIGMKINGVEYYLTDKTNNCEKTDSLELFGYGDSYSKIKVPAYSVVTMVLNGTVGNKSIKIVEKNNSVSALVGETLEFEVTDENGNKVSGVSIPDSVKCTEEGEFSVIAEHDGLKDSYNVTVVGNGSKVRIIGSGSERALKVDGNDVVIADRDNTPSQIWTIEEYISLSGGNYYAFKNEKTGKYLSTESFLTTSKTEGRALEDKKVIWKLEKDKGLYRIINEATGDSVDVYNHATAEGSQVGVYGGYYATANQLFYFELAQPQTEVEVEYTAGEIELTGTPFGTEPWDGDVNVTADKAWDGDKETFFHAGRNDDRTGYTAIDLGEDHLPFNKVTINSRPGFEYRGWEAVLSGSNEKDGEYTVIHQFTEEDFQRGEFASVDLGEYVDYRYVKYETPNGGYTNVGEVNLIYSPGKYEYTWDSVIYGKDWKYAVVSYLEGEKLKNVEIIHGYGEGVDSEILKVSNLADDLRVQLFDKNNILLATFFIKRY